jgi:MoaA/NifB/PqqE/SkfB family radical SAM enzyme
MTYAKTLSISHSPLWGQQTLAHLDFELTERCNNACIHCYINQPGDDQHCQAHETDTPFIKDIFQQAADLGCMSVRLTGGEPLLREDFPEIYQHARRLGLKVTLSSNATLITEALCRLFTRIPPGNPLDITVYGMHPDSYDAVAGRRGAFDEFWNSITLLQKHGIPFTVRKSILPQNQADLEQFEAFSASLPEMEGRNSYSMNFDLRARRDDPTKNERIKRLRHSPEATLALLTRDPENYIDSKRQFAARFMGPPGDKLFRCGAGLGTCVDAYGNAQMCLLLRHPDTVYPLDPDLHHENHPGSDLPPLAYALKVFFPEVRELRSTNPAYLQRCAICFLKGLCDQCPAKSWEEHGTLDTPVDYLCEVAHAQARYLGLVNEGENAWELPEVTWRARLKAFTESGPS